MVEVQKIKQLQSLLNARVGESQVLKIELSDKQNEYNQKLKSISKLREEINKIKKSNTFKVSEHAILRYIERVKNISISEIEKEILTEELTQIAEKSDGTGTFPHEKGYNVVMKDYTVTTVIKKKKKKDLIADLSLHEPLN